MRFKADESSQAITGPYRQAHPEITTSGKPCMNMFPFRCRCSPMWGHLPRLSSRARLGQPSEPHDDFLSSETSLCLCVSVVIGLFLGNKPRPADPLPRRHRASRHPFHPQQWRVGKKWLPENHGPRVGAYRLRQRRLPGYFLVNGTDWPEHSHAGANDSKAIPQQSQRNLQRCNSSGSLAVPCSDLESRSVIFFTNTDGFDDLFVTAPGAESSLPQQRQRDVH